MASVNTINTPGGNSEPMQADNAILVWGAGAIGGLLAAYWARAGLDVTVVDIDPEHVATCKQNGITITGPVECFTQGIKAFTPEQLHGQWQRIVLAVKAQHTLEATEQLREHLPHNGYVLSAQNGLNEHIIANLLGTERVIGAFVNFGADYHGPGHILYGNRGAVVVGEIDHQVLDRTRNLHGLLQIFEPDAILTDDIWAYLWGKMGYGAMLFATALTHDSMSQSFADPDRAPVLINLAREVMQVASLEGITPRGFNGYDPAAFHPDASLSQAQLCIDALADFTSKTAKTHSGIYRDIAVRRRRTEADAQLGPIVDIATRHHIDVPLTRRLITLIHDIEDGRREQSADTFNILTDAVNPLPAGSQAKTDQGPAHDNV